MLLFMAAVYSWLDWLKHQRFSQEQAATLLSDTPPLNTPMNKPPSMVADPSLDTGEIGYIVTSLKTAREARVGDTVTLKKYVAKE